MKVQFSLGYLVFFILMAMVSLGAKEDSKYPGWQNYKNEKLKVTFKIPKDWVSKESEQDGKITLSSQEDLTIKDTVRIEVKVSASDKSDDDAVSVFKLEDGMKKNVKGFQEFQKFVEDASKFKGYRCTYKFDEHGLTRDVDARYFRYANTDYLISFVGTGDLKDFNQELYDKFLEAFDPFTLQPHPNYQFELPKGWHEFEKEGTILAASKSKENSLSEGIVSVLIRRVGEKTSLQTMITDFITSSITNEKGKQVQFAKAKTSKGVEFIWFDVPSDKEEPLKERYHFMKHGESVFIIHFICQKSDFEKEHMMVLAGCLQSFAVVPLN